MLSLIAILISLVLLIFLGYKGWSIILLAPLLALLAAGLTGLFEGGAPHLLINYTETFMSNMATYVKSYFPYFLLGAIFGTLMDRSGSARSIANFIFDKLGEGKEVVSIVIVCALLTYGGVSLFVVVFVVYPIGAVLFKRADIPKRLFPGTLAAGSFTFTMTALPGSPQVQNTIPMQYFGTDAFAAPGLGVIAAAIMCALSLIYLTRRCKNMKAKGEGYGDHPNEIIAQVSDEETPNFALSITPIAIVVGVNLILSKLMFTTRRADHYGYLADYDTDISGVSGTWALILGLSAGIMFVLLVNIKRYKGGFVNVLKDGVSSSFLAILNTASETGYGNVIKTLTGYSVLATAMFAVSMGNPLVGGAISTTVLAGVTGSASGGMSIALSTFSDTLLEQAAAMNISPQVLHRVVALSSGVMDSLPHNGAVITLLAVCGLTHKEAYRDIGINTIAIPLVAAVVIIFLGTLGLGS